MSQTDIPIEVPPDEVYLEAAIEDAKRLLKETGND